MKKLVLRCDDFGCAIGTNQAILALAETGLNLNVSVLICGPEARTGLEQLVQRAPQICLGIHLAVTSEWDQVKWGPVGHATRQTGLVDGNHHFRSTTEVASRLPAHLIVEEARAQIEEALSWGIPFVYMDEHMEFGWLQDIQSRHQALADEFNLIYKPRLPALPVLEEMPVELIPRWRTQIRQMNGSPHLFVTHPAFEDESMFNLFSAGNPPGSISAQRHQEFQALASKEWKESLDLEKVELVTYRNL